MYAASYICDATIEHVSSGAQMVHVIHTNTHMLTREKERGNYFTNSLIPLSSMHSFAKASIPCALPCDHSIGSHDHP